MIAEHLFSSLHFIDLHPFSQITLLPHRQNKTQNVPIVNEAQEKY